MKSHPCNLNYSCQKLGRKNWRKEGKWENNFFFLKREEKKRKENAAFTDQDESTSINIDSRASRVPFPLQDEVIILAFNGRTRTSTEAEHEK